MPIKPDVALIPAYGRTYTDADAVLADWAADKDFQVSGGGPYVNKADAATYLDGHAVRVWYRKGVPPVKVQ